MRRFRLFFVLWAGIVLCGSIARAQERPLDTLHLFNAHADTVWVGFDEVLPLSAMGDSNFHYLYRWFSKGKKIGEENILNYSFTGERKAKVIGQRFSTALPWPGEEYLDMEYFKDTPSRTYDNIDTIYLKAFSEYESDSTAKWIWTVRDNHDREDILFGPRIKIVYSRKPGLYGDSYTVKCTLLTETEEKHSPEGEVSFWPAIQWADNKRADDVCLTDSGRRGVYYMNVLDVYIHAFTHTKRIPFILTGDRPRIPFIQGGLKRVSNGHIMENHILIYNISLCLLTEHGIGMLLSTMEGTVTTA